MESDLTRGAVAQISEGEGEGLKPVLQVCDLRLVSTAQTTTERYRMLLSDGIHSQQAMLATQLNHIVKSDLLQKGSIVQLQEFICNVIQGRRIIIVINLDVLQSQCELIGNPNLYNGTGVSPSQQQNRPSPSSIPVQTSNSTGLNQSLRSPPSSNLTPQSYSFNNQNLTNLPSVTPKTEPASNNPPYTGSYGSMPGCNLPNTTNMANPRPDNLNQNQNQGFQFRPPVNNLTTNNNNTSTTFGRSMQPPVYANRGPTAKKEVPARIVPIAALNPYQGNWTIKARVTLKGEIRNWKNNKGEGKVFSFDLLDSEGGEIRATCFNHSAEQFYNQIEAGRVYLISKGSLKPAQKNYNYLNNDYEMSLDSTAMVQLCLEEDSSIPKQNFNFRQIGEIESMENNSPVDLIGIITFISPAGTIMTKNGTETQKRTLQLKDMSGKSVEITLWGNFCTREGQNLQSLCDSGVFPVLAVKFGKVSDYNGRSVGTISSTQLFVDPTDIPEANRLRDWFNTEGKSIASLSITRESNSMGRTDARKTVSQIKDEDLGRAEKPDWITVKGCISFVKMDSFCYTACPLMINGERKCGKKVNNNGDGTWHCDRCEQTFTECEYRYLLQFQIQDHTGTAYVTAFQECGEEILGISAKDLHFIKFEEQDEARFVEIIRGIMFNQYIFKLKVKEENFNDEQRVKCTVVKAEKVNPSSESKYLLGMIDKLLQEGSNPVSNNNNYNTNNVTTTNNNNVQLTNSGSMRYRETTINQLGQNGNNGYLPQCSNCGLSGHGIQSCPTNSSMNRPGPSGVAGGGGFANGPLNSSISGGSDSNVCFKCQQPGHWARDCPGLGGRYNANKQFVGGY